MTAVVLQGDARRLPLLDESVDLIVTSPPYFGLRSYTDAGEHYAGQIGSEATPGEFLAALWECTAEWMRVLKPSGSMFINLGDKYAQRDGQGPMGHRGGSIAASSSAYHAGATDVGGRPWDNGGVPAKSLLGLPWRYALGCIDRFGAIGTREQFIARLTDDVLDGCLDEDDFWRQIREYDANPPEPRGGLILRAEIIWAKPNGLPESVTDRVRRSHEQVFHFTKLPRYYAAIDEIREPHETPRHAPGNKNRGVTAEQIRGTATASKGISGHLAEPDREWGNALGKLPGSVWSIPSAPLQVPARLGVDHFAAFPPALVRPLVLGWSPPGICTACSEGRRPVVAKRLVPRDQWINTRKLMDGNEPFGNNRGMNADQRVGGWTQATITGYECACRRCICSPDHTGEDIDIRPDCPLHGVDDWTPPPTRPALVLDPFGGTGTTALVAAVHGRTGISIDRSADYTRLAQWRVADPGERARALDVPKPPPVIDGQGALFDDVTLGWEKDEDAAAWSPGEKDAVQWVPEVGWEAGAE